MKTIVGCSPTGHSKSWISHKKVVLSIKPAKTINVTNSQFFMSEINILWLWFSQVWVKPNFSRKAHIYSSVYLCETCVPDCACVCFPPEHRDENREVLVSHHKTGSFIGGEKKEPQRGSSPKQNNPEGSAGEKGRKEGREREREREREIKRKKERDIS